MQKDSGGGGGGLTRESRRDEVRAGHRWCCERPRQGRHGQQHRRRPQGVRSPHYVHQDRYVLAAGRAMFSFLVFRKPPFQAPEKALFGVYREGVGFVVLEPAFDPISGEGFDLLSLRFDFPF